MAGGIAAGGPARLGAAGVGVRPGAPRGRSGRRAGLGGTGRCRGPGVVRGPGRGPRGAGDRSVRYGCAASADHLRAGGAAGLQRGCGGPGAGGGPAGHRSVALCRELSALGAAEGHGLSGPAVPAVAGAAAPGPVPVAPGRRCPRTAVGRLAPDDACRRVDGKQCGARDRPAGDGGPGAPRGTPPGAQPRTPRRAMETAASAISSGTSAAPSSIRRTAASTTPWSSIAASRGC